MQIVLLSGNVSSGKTTLAEQLRERFGFEILKTKETLQKLAASKRGHGVEPERRSMQEFGEKLDRGTGGQWVERALTRLIRSASMSKPYVVVDAVRILNQIRAIRRAYGFAVTHIHLKAPEAVLASRYANRKGSSLRELRSYAEVELDPTEAQVGELENVADAVVDTARCTPQDVLVRAATHLSLYSRDYARCVDVIVGGQFGSEGTSAMPAKASRQ